MSYKGGNLERYDCTMCTGRGLKPRMISLLNILRGLSGKETCNVVVGTTGFEPATPASRTRCSTRLSHVPTIH